MSHEAVKHELDRLRREVVGMASGDPAAGRPKSPRSSGGGATGSALRPAVESTAAPASWSHPPVGSISDPPLPGEEIEPPAYHDPSLDSSPAGIVPTRRGRSRVWWLAAMLNLSLVNAPGWLASATVHAGLLMALALATIAAKPGSIVQSLNVAWGDVETNDALVELPQVISLTDDQSDTSSADLTRDTVGAEAVGGGASETIDAPTAAQAYVGETPGAGVGDELASALGHGGDVPDDAEPSDGEAKEEPIRGKGFASFCGLEAKGYRFVFIVDSSGSMQGERFNAACQELMTSITDLDEHQSFYVIFFNATEYPQAYPQVDNEMSPAGLASTERLAAWMRGVVPNGWTNPDGAIRRGLDLKPDAIFLLTDGEFNQGGALAVIRRHKFRTAIHTVAFASPEGAPMLREIAARTGGTFRFVP